jgi:hypothetical protein
MPNVPLTDVQITLLAELYRDAILELKERAVQRLVKDARKLTAEARRRKATSLFTRKTLRQSTARV